MEMVLKRRFSIGFCGATLRDALSYVGGSVKVRDMGDDSFASRIISAPGVESKIPLAHWMQVKSERNGR